MNTNLSCPEDIELREEPMPAPQHPAAVDPTKRVRSRDRLYLKVDEPIKMHARAAAAAIESLRSALEEDDWRAECHLKYNSAQQASQAAKTLCTTLKGITGINTPDGGETSRGRRVPPRSIRVSWSEFLAASADIHQLANEVALTSTGHIVNLTKRLRKHAEGFLRIFTDLADADPLVAYELEEVGAEVLAWGNELRRHHESVVRFLRQIAEHAVDKQPEEDRTGALVHHVRILGCDEQKLDGHSIRLNSAQRRALFTLAMLGNTFGIGEFAAQYSRSDTNPRNPANVVAQALQGLRKILPRLEISRPSPKRRTVHGLNIQSKFSRRSLAKFIVWLR